LENLENPNMGGIVDTFQWVDKQGPIMSGNWPTPVNVQMKCICTRITFAISSHFSVQTSSKNSYNSLRFHIFEALKSK
jgi:hypothetical protein